jgi:hypothetical protein
MTLDRVIVDLGKAFEASQLYVARESQQDPKCIEKQMLTTRIVSRARSLKGLKVVALPYRNLGGANAQVKEFFETFFEKKPSPSQTPQSLQASEFPQSSQTPRPSQA